MMYHNLFDYESDEIEIDFLFPNGFYYSSKFSKNLTINEMKNKLWTLVKTAGNQLYFKLAENYYFSAITSDAKQVDYHDSNQRLSDLNLINWTFKVNEFEKDNEEKQSDAKLAFVTKINPEELDNTKDIELIEYRIDTLVFVRDTILNEFNMSESALESHMIVSSFPPNLEINLENLSFSTEKSFFEDECLKYIDIVIHDEDDASILQVSVNQKPTDLIREYFKNKLKGHINEAQIIEIVRDYEKTYVFNVCGCNDIIFGNTESIGNFKYIKKCIWQQQLPHLYLKPYNNLLTGLSKSDFNLINSFNKTIDNLAKRQEFIQMQAGNENFDLTLFHEYNFSVSFDYVALLPKLLDCDKIFFKTAIFVGKESITKIIESDKFDLTAINAEIKLPIQLNQIIDYEIPINKLPRSSKLSFCLFFTGKKKRVTLPFMYISINLFDYKSTLINGRKKLYMWPLDSNNDTFENLSQVHVSGSNPEKDSSYLQVAFSCAGNIKFPEDKHFENLNLTNFEYGFIEDLLIHNADIEMLIKKNSLHELSNFERRYLWKNRHKCQDYPHSLVKLVKCVDWTNHSDVLELHRMLQTWPLLKPLEAILLLHSDVVDLQTRSYAVKCLDVNMKNEEVEFYLLQLVQALKNEPYLKNDLSKFLLNRAFQSSKIGFNLFWILKTEVGNIKFRDRFRVMLEGYCKRKGPCFDSLIKQVQTVDTLTHLSQSVRNMPASYFTLVKKKFLMEKLSETEYVEATSNLVNPVDNSMYLGKIVPSECFLLSSAKRPLYLSWKNHEAFNEFFDNNPQMIFKNGDDLRQDMLTIQALKLMDIIWKNENLDLKMLIYDVFPTGNKLGFIEIVKNSSTIFKILTESGAKGRYQMDDYQLLKWITDNNPKEKFNQAIDNFTKSCAGFCVATFVLGIGDRHPSNIMVNKEGKLFHIDFGHFLGHYKSKFGIKRERVPFVLTEHFTKVITKGAEDPVVTPEFAKFKSLCENAYMTLRRYSNILIDLFVIMLSSGMPELNSTEDIIFLKNRLAPELSDEDALNYFRDQANDSLVFSFTTRFDWIFHALNHRD